MRNVTVSAILMICGCMILLGGVSRAGEPVEQAQAVLEKLLTAVQENDYAAFVADGTPQFKAGITKQMFEGVSAQMAESMKGGYSTSYLGELNQQGSQVHLWKLTFRDGGDDVLAKLALLDGSVAGFWLQ